MDGSHFDALTRTLTAPGSRRAAVRGLLAGMLGLLGAPAGQAAKKQKKPCPPCKKRKKGKCKQTLPDGTPCPGGTCQGGRCISAQACARRCGGKTCGDDGCGGSCGGCVGGTCSGGTCTCPPGNEVCQGTCRVACEFAGMARNSITCECCGRSGADCSLQTNRCCTGTCLPGGNPGHCTGIAAGSSCQFDGQCHTGFCLNGTCGCPQGRQVCAGGAGCSDECGPDEAIAPDHCLCCLRNGVSCTTGQSGCCAGADRCSSGTCAGLSDGQPCTFDAQCTSQFGCNGGQCGRAIDPNP